MRWPCAGSACARCCGSATTTSSAVFRWRSSRSTCRTWPTPASRQRRGSPGAGPKRGSASPGGPTAAPRGSWCLPWASSAVMELNYSSDIDLIFLYDEEGQTCGPRVVSNAEFFARMGAEIVRLLADHTSLGMAYRVDMRLRPEGEQGALARSLAATLGYYETRGRTWERQALIKCRPIAGDLELGQTFLEAITPFVYRRYLGASEIGEIKAMKRRIEQRTVSAGTRRFRGQDGPRRTSATSSSSSSSSSSCMAASIPRFAAPTPCWRCPGSNRSAA